MRSRGGRRGAHSAHKAGAMGPGFGLAGRGPMGPRPPNAAAPPRRRKPTEATAAPWARSPGGRWGSDGRSVFGRLNSRGSGKPGSLPGEWRVARVLERPQFGRGEAGSAASPGGRRGAHSAHKAGAMGPGFGLAGRGPMGPRPPNAAALRGAGSPPRRRRPPGQEAQGAASAKRNGA